MAELSRAALAPWGDAGDDNDGVDGLLACPIMVSLGYLQVCGGGGRGGGIMVSLGYLQVCGGGRGGGCHGREG
jgi:hypothetical protein